MLVSVLYAFQSNSNQKQQNTCLIFAHAVCHNSVVFCFFFLFPAKMESLTVRNSTATEENESKETFIAFARVYSGVVKKGQRLFVLGPKYDPAQFLCMVNSSANTTVSPQCKKKK